MKNYNLGLICLTRNGKNKGKYTNTYRVEVDSDELSEAGGIVVPHGLGVAPRLQHGVGLDDLVLKGGLTLLPLARGADGGKVGNDLKEEHRISFFWWGGSFRFSPFLCFQSFLHRTRR